MEEFRYAAYCSSEEVMGVVTVPRDWMAERRELSMQVCPTGAEEALCELKGPYKAQANSSDIDLGLESVPDWLARVTPGMVIDHANMA